MSSSYLLFNNKLVKYENVDYYVGPSNISGMGVFSKINVDYNQFLFPIITNGKKITTLGSKVNHCWNPNTKLIKTNQGWWLQALKNLTPNSEITTDYRDTPSFINKPNSNWNC